MYSFSLDWGSTVEALHGVSGNDNDKLLTKVLGSLGSGYSDTGACLAKWGCLKHTPGSGLPWATFLTWVLDVPEYEYCFREC